MGNINVTVLTLNFPFVDKKAIVTLATKSKYELFITKSTITQLMICLLRLDCLISERYNQNYLHS